MNTEVINALVQKNLNEAAVGGAPVGSMAALEAIRANPFVRVVEVSLNELYANGSLAPKRLPLSGYGVIFLAKLSHPGARLQLDINGEWKSFSPGDRFRFPFKDLTVRLGLGSVLLAPQKAYLLVALHPDAWPEESNILAGQGRMPIDLLGETYQDQNLGATFGQVKTFVTVAEDTDPTLLAYGSAGTFEGQGFKKLRVLINGLTNGGNATSFDLIPWYLAGGWGGQALWHEQGTERISVPDSDSSGQQYRVLVVPWAGGVGYFSIRNLLATLRTGLGLCIQGIE